MSNPYSSPQGSFNTPKGGPSGYAESKVKGPAIGLMVAMGIGIAVALLSVLLNMLGIGIGAAAADQPEGLANMMSGTIGIISNVIGIALGGLIIFGSMKMMKLESYGLAMTICILSIVPCTNPCCILGIPFGIWGVIALSDPAVKSAFR